MSSPATTTTSTTPATNAFGIAGWLYNEPILRAKTMTLLELPAVARGADVSVLELCSVFFASQTAPYLNDVRIALADAGMRVPSIAVDGPNISQPDAAARRTHIETVKQWFHVARAIGAEAIRVNSGGAIDASEDDLTRIVEAYRELATEAEGTGVTLLIENHGGASANPANLRRFLAEVDSPWFRSCPDTGNFPDGTWREGVAAMLPYAVSTHIKVYAYAEDGTQPYVGHDGIDRSSNLREILKMLRDADYRGPLCIEAGIEADQTEAARGAIAYVTRLLAEIDAERQG
ncbi:MAG: sugar phosphate isomerase/epimerase family protein [Thermomicrobiales bacterium]